jgi:hypothetical protein
MGYIEAVQVARHWGLGEKRPVKIGETPLAYRPKPGDPKAAAWARFMAVQHALAELLGIEELKEPKKKKK